MNIEKEVILKYIEYLDKYYHDHYWLDEYLRYVLDRYLEKKEDA